MEKTEEVTQEAIIEALRAKDAGFKWESFTAGWIVSRDQLIREIEQGTEVGKRFLDLVRLFVFNLEALFKSDVPNALGKRQRCAVCGTEILNTKAGNGKVFCCGQMMEVQTPKPLPGSD